MVVRNKFRSFKLKKLVSSIAIASVLLCSPTTTFAKTTNSNEDNATATQEGKTVNQPDIAGESGMTIDFYNGEVLYAKNKNKKVYPASITKVLTALVVLDHLKMKDKVTFSNRAVSEDQSNQQLFFKEGEVTNVKNALSALMIISANDAAVALAETVSGSVEDFAKLMNKKAKELGAKNSNFVSPNGLPNPDHYTTASDYAKIAKGINDHPELLDFMSLRSATIKTDQREVDITSPNTIPKSNPNALGGKTGYTDAAQHTLVEVLEKDGRRVISVVFHSTKGGKYTDINKMSDYAFSLFSSTKLYSANEIFQIVELNGKEYPLKLANDVVVSYPKGSDMEFVQSVEWDTSKESFKPGEKIGYLVLKRDGKVVKKVGLTTDKALAYDNVKASIEKMSNDKKTSSDESSNSNKIAMVLGLIFAVPIIVFSLLIFLTRKKN